MKLESKESQLHRKFLRVPAEKSEAAKEILCTLDVFCGGRRRGEEKRRRGREEVVGRTKEECSCGTRKECNRQWGPLRLEHLTKHKGRVLEHRKISIAPSVQWLTELLFLNVLRVDELLNTKSFLPDLWNVWRGFWFSWRCQKKSTKHCKKDLTTTSSQTSCLQNRGASLSRLSSILAAWLTVWFNLTLSGAGFRGKTPYALGVCRHFCTEGGWCQCKEDASGKSVVMLPSMTAWQESWDVTEAWKGCLWLVAF